MEKSEDLQPEMSESEMDIQIDHEDAEALRALAAAIVANHQRVATMIVHLWMEANNSVILSNPDEWILYPKPRKAANEKD